MVHGEKRFNNCLVHSLSGNVYIYDLGFVSICFYLFLNDVCICYYDICMHHHQHHHHLNGFCRPLCLTKEQKLILWQTFKSTWKIYLILDLDNGSLLLLRYNPSRCFSFIFFSFFPSLFHTLRGGSFLRIKTVGLSWGNYWFIFLKILYTRFENSAESKSTQTRLLPTQTQLSLVNGQILFKAVIPRYLKRGNLSFI